MSEGIQNQNAELNDAALEGVIGGLSYPKDIATRAKHLCGDCKMHNHAKISCTADPDVLEQFMRKNGSISSMTDCPFR